jgi:hypothetical protein
LIAWLMAVAVSNDTGKRNISGPGDLSRTISYSGVRMAHTVSGSDELLPRLVDHGFPPTLRSQGKA